MQIPTITIIKAQGLYSGFMGPRNITRGEGSERELIPCLSYPVQATPFWKINDTIYYYSDVPPPLKVSRSGREIIITTVDLSLNNTSFQCFIPSSSGNDLTSSSIGVLIVNTENGTIHRYKLANLNKSIIATLFT